MKPLMKAVHAAYIQKKNWKKELHNFLLKYTATPHTTILIELLLNCNTRTKLPQVVNIADKSKDDKVPQTDELVKSKMKSNTETPTSKEI